MKLILAVVHDEDGIRLMEELNKNSFSVTKLATTGGFLKSGNTTLLIGTDEEKVQQVIDIIKEKSQTRKQVMASPMPMSSIPGSYPAYPIMVNVGGATIFVVDVERFEKV